LPWLLSLGAHAAFVAVAFFLLLSPPAYLGPRVNISLVGGSGLGGAALAARSGTRAAAASRTALVPTRPSAKSNAPSPAAGTGSAAAPREGAAADGGPMSSSPDEYSFRASRNGSASTSAAAPSASDVLSDVASMSPASSEAIGTPGSQAQGAQPGGSPGVSAGGTEWGWQGLPRKLVRKRNPEFPALLSSLGQEVEGEARITVAPSGIVTRVEITRSSGYIEIDASVEAALRDYLFSRVDGRDDSKGTVKFRFRLEKQD
jgi:TonB family protein